MVSIYIASLVAASAYVIECDPNLLPACICLWIIVWSVSGLAIAAKHKRTCSSNATTHADNLK